MEIEELRRIIAGLSPRQSLTDAFECYPDSSSQRFSSQKEHLLGWLADYDKPGAYSRKHPGRDARFFYNHFRCAPGLLWLAEALGEDTAALRRAIAEVKAARRNPSSQCAAFRKAVPWDRVAELAVRAGSVPASGSAISRLRSRLKADRPLHRRA